MKTFDKRLPLAWLLGIPATYLAVSYLENFHKTALQVALWTILVHSLVNIFGYYLLDRIKREIVSNRIDASLKAVLFTALIVVLPASYNLAKPFTNLFDPLTFHLDASVRFSFANALIPAFFIAMIAVGTARRKNWRESRIYLFLEENLGGLLIAFLFFCVYLLFASIFNRPHYDADDVFFDADSNLYRYRFTMPTYEDYYWRPAHPFILLIIRPFVALLGFLFNGNKLFAAFTLNAMAGGLCVYLVWYFVKHKLGNPLYALLITALFGASSAQLVFGSVIESYIYLAAVALAFLVILLTDKPLYLQVIAGLTAFGITISNVAQTFIAHFFVKRNIKQLIIYGLIIGVLVVPLSLLHNYIYPDSQPYFWDFATLEAEGHNQFPATFQRADYLARVMTLHSFVAPEPLVVRDGLPFPKVWMFRASIKKDPMLLANYETLLGDGLAIVWAGLLVLGGVLFLKNIRRQDNGFSFAFIATLLFYFVLHLRYGKDVFLYSVNWTYAILLFLALAWQDLAEKRWFQILLLAFVLLLIVNNLGMFETMMRITAPTVKFPIWK